MKKNTKRSSWYSEKNTEARPHPTDSSLENLYRCGKFIATVKKES